MRVLRTEILFAVRVLKATLIAIRATRGSLFQKNGDETAKGMKRVKMVFFENSFIIYILALFNLFKKNMMGNNTRY